MKNKQSRYSGLVGVVLIGFGFLLTVFYRLEILDFHLIREMILILILIGSGLFGNAMGEKLKSKAIEKNPQEAKRLVIEQNDERNKLILNMAKSVAFDSMTTIMIIAILFLGLLGYLNKQTLIIVISVIVISQGIMLYQLSKIKKIM